MSPTALSVQHQGRQSDAPDAHSGMSIAPRAWLLWLGRKLKGAFGIFYFPSKKKSIKDRENMGQNIKREKREGIH